MKSLFKSLVVSILTWEAKLVIARKKPFIIGVTGNLGKTSTKDAIYNVMKSHYHTRRSEKSMNSEFGVPLTILGEKSGWNNPFKWLIIIIKGISVPFKKSYPTHLVLEIGADRPGDIEKISSWVKPDITVVTQFGEVPVHVEFFKDREEVVKEKGYLVKALKKGGLFIYNADDNDGVRLSKTTSERILSFGIREDSYAKADNVKVYGNIEGVEADVLVNEEKCRIVLPEVLGKSPIYTSLPSLIVAKELNIPLDIACASLRDGDLPKGRMRILQGIKGSILIDDSYNASPKAVEHGLKTLGDLHLTESGGRKIAVLGDMLELGDFTRAEHYRIGEVASKYVHRLFTVGIRARVMAEGALNNGMKDENIMQCDNSILAGKELLNIVDKGDVIYIKGSQGMRMERVVKMLLKEEHDPKKLLVRQEKEWENR